MWCVSDVLFPVQLEVYQFEAERGKMIRYGAAPFLECSTRGDRRFSAFCAIVNGKSIEIQYQAAKVFVGGETGLDWRKAKGRKAVNLVEVQRLYSSLWEQYIDENPELLRILINATGISDMFGQPRHVCQATELWRIRALKRSAMWPRSPSKSVTTR